MNNQNRRPSATNQTTNPQHSVPPSKKATNLNQQGKRKLDLSESEAQALLTLNKFEADQKPKTHPPLKLLAIAIALIVIAVIAGYAVESAKPGESSNSSNSANDVGLPNQSPPSSGSGVSNQINQDVKSCSNPVNAALVC